MEVTYAPGIGVHQAHPKMLLFKLFIDLVLLDMSTSRKSIPTIIIIQLFKEFTRSSTKVNISN